ncbi:uncharacterized protein LOC131153667 [Malania oleifera]|uniref:uncharacterized protein LOC131153667 n=1 Tax=Malania oleifera TaxID=397392 RepID=UPI0025AE6835|nr:uncharacterized protein LOC131153667 [Malania oleifera]
MQLKEELTLIQLESRSISEYLHAIKVLVDELAVIDSPISMDDITLYALNSLGPEYYEIPTFIQARETSLTFEEFHDVLVGHESYLRHVDVSNALLVAIANSTQRRTLASTFNCNQRSNPGSSGHRRSNSGVKFVNCAATNASTDKKWLVDSAASHNMTSDLANLSIHWEYDGTK